MEGVQGVTRLDSHRELDNVEMKIKLLDCNMVIKMVR